MTDWLFGTALLLLLTGAPPICCACCTITVNFSCFLSAVQCLEICSFSDPQRLVYSALSLLSAADFTSVWTSRASSGPFMPRAAYASETAMALNQTLSGSKVSDSCWVELTVQFPYSRWEIPSLCYQKEAQTWYGFRYLQQQISTHAVFHTAMWVSFGVYWSLEESSQAFWRINVSRYISL